jgi:hypothetical protein
MIPGEVADLLQYALQKLQPGIWYVVDDINGFNPILGGQPASALFYTKIYYSLVKFYQGMEKTTCLI